MSSQIPRSKEGGSRSVREEDVMIEAEAGVIRLRMEEKPQAMYCGQPLGARKSRIHSPLESPKGTIPAHTLILYFGPPEM